MEDYFSEEFKEGMSKVVINMIEEVKEEE